MGRYGDPSFSGAAEQAASSDPWGVTMRNERPSVDRRGFLRHGIAVSAGALVWRRGTEGLLGRAGGSAGVPFIITSHTNETGRDAMEQAWLILSSGGSGCDHGRCSV